MSELGLVVLPSSTAPTVPVDPERLAKAIGELTASVKAGTHFDSNLLTKVGVPRAVAVRIAKAARRSSLQGVWPRFVQSSLPKAILLACRPFRETRGVPDMEFDKATLLLAFGELGRAAWEAGTTIEIAIYGGSALMLIFDWRAANLKATGLNLCLLLNFGNTHLETLVSG
jgi:hypothetical protein